MPADRYPKSFYRRLAKTLMLVLSIPEGDELVFVFGCGSEQSNTEAIANWIASLENEINLEEASMRLDLLARQAANRLQEVMT